MEETKYLKRRAMPGRFSVALFLFTMLFFLNTWKGSGQTAVASNSGPICTGSPVMLHETGGDAVTWEWSSSGAAVFDDRTLQNPTATGVSSGEVFTVRITDTAGNTAIAATAVTVFSAAPARPEQITGEETYCANTSGVVFGISPVVTATSYLWEVPDGVVLTSGQGTIAITVDIGPTAPTSGTIRVFAINACGTSSPARSKNLYVNQIPSAAGPVSGLSTYTPGEAGVPYSVGLITEATSYAWSYSGAGVTINGNGSSNVTLDFSADATAGRLSVSGVNSCGTGSSATLELAASAKQLQLSSLLLEGLYSGSGTMRQAWNATGPQYATGVADQITIELHDAASYATTVWSLPGVPLSTTGNAEINIPAAYSGSYYITVRHRNSIETTTALPVSFSGSLISQSFAAPVNIYGGNLKLSADNYYLIYGGDANQNGVVDTGDYTPVVNDAARYTRGYVFTDLDGNGSVDTGDYSIMVNNAARYVRAIHP